METGVDDEAWLKLKRMMLVEFSQLLVVSLPCLAIKSAPSRGYWMLVTGADFKRMA